MNNLNPDIIRPYHAFNRENTWYVINRDRFVYEQVPESFVRFLKDLEKNPNLPIPQAHQERLIRLKLRRASNPPKAPRPKPAEVFEPPVATATIFVTQQCNHDCIYCYGGGGEYGDPGIMEDEIGLKTLDWLWAQRGDLKSLAVSFSGGEPLLNFELIRRMVDHAHQLETQGDARFKFTVATNAALLNDRVLDFMETHDIYALIGFDGPREIQDRNRPLRNGRSSYDTVLPRIQKLIANMPERVTLRASIWQKGDIPRVVNEMRKLGPRIFQTPIVSPGGHLGEGAREPTSTWEDPVAALSAAIPDFLKVLHQRDLATLKSFFSWIGFNELLRVLSRRTQRTGSCGVGREIVSVSAKGTLYPCHRFVGHERYAIGDIMTGEVNRGVYLDPPLRKTSQCLSCWAKHLCNGGCIHDHLARTGHRFTPDGGFCEMTWEIFETGIQLACRLTREEKEFLYENRFLKRPLCPLDLWHG